MTISPPARPERRYPPLCFEARDEMPEDYRRMDTLFHLTIAELTGSSLLLEACTDARMRLNGLLNAIPVLQRNIDNTAGQHAAIVTAILAGDGLLTLAFEVVARDVRPHSAALKGVLIDAASIRQAEGIVKQIQMIRAKTGG